MADKPLGFGFDLSPRDLAEQLRKKGVTPSFAWQDLWRDQNARAFTVAGVMKMDVLSDLFEAAKTAEAKGQTFDEFKDNLIPTLKKKGWWGPVEVFDPRTGEVKTVDLSAPWRLKTIYNTNMNTARAAGRWSDQEETRDQEPYRVYLTRDDAQVRPAHKAWDNLVLHRDDPWWDTHYPPNGWGCRCETETMDGIDLEDRGLEVGEAPEIKMVEYKNKRTGKTELVPEGIDPGWDYNPGKTQWMPNKSDYPDAVFKAGETPTPLKIKDRKDAAQAIKDKLDGFTHTGIKRIRFQPLEHFMETDGSGAISLSTNVFPDLDDFCPADDLVGGLKALGRKPLTFNQEYACEALWHELCHNRQLAAESPMTMLASDLMEAATQWTARRTYPKMLAALGNHKPAHLEAVKAQGYGYPVQVERFGQVLDALGINEADVLDEVESLLEKTPRDRWPDDLSKLFAQKSGQDQSKIRPALMNLGRAGNVFQVVLEPLKK